MRILAKFLFALTWIGVLHLARLVAIESCEQSTLQSLLIGLGVLALVLLTIREFLGDDHV